MRTSIAFTPTRWMQFVDGENLTIRAQALFADWKIELELSDRYRKDCFLLPDYFGPRATALESQPIRSFYYTTVVGDDPLVQTVRERLWARSFEPHVFKKEKQSGRTKGVDIALATDMLSHAFRGNYDTAVLVAGDRDYRRLVEEVKRLGKRVDVRFIERVTHPELKLASDQFIDITGHLFDWARQWVAEHPAAAERMPVPRD